MKSTRTWLSILLAGVALLVATLACATVITLPTFYICPTPYPYPTATTLWGTPPPTPRPTATPYVISPPRDFYLGDAVFIGQPGSAMRLRFRLYNVQSQIAPPINGQARNLQTWWLEIRNLGSQPYDTIPVALMFVSRLTTSGGEQSGQWLTTDKAMQAAGYTAEDYSTLQPGMMRLYRLAAYTPVGSVRQITYWLDSTGNNRITWVNQINPNCIGEIAS